MKILTLLFLAGLTFSFNYANARDLNCDPTALTYDLEECAAQRSKATKVNAKSTNKQSFDAVTAYNKKFQKLDEAKKVKVNSDDSYGVYLATSKKNPTSTVENLAAQNVGTKKAKQIIKKGFDQVGFGAKIPLKPNNVSQ